MKFCRFDQNNKSEAPIGFAFFFARWICILPHRALKIMSLLSLVWLTDLQNKIFKSRIFIHPAAFDAFIQL